MNIVLAGMPGSGKTTVAKALARLGFAVYDTDEEIVKEHGAINEIFSARSIFAISKAERWKSFPRCRAR